MHVKKTMLVRVCTCTCTMYAKDDRVDAVVHAENNCFTVLRPVANDAGDDDDDAFYDEAICAGRES